jgi:hypothetical protein
MLPLSSDESSILSTRRTVCRLHQEDHNLWGRTCEQTAAKSMNTAPKYNGSECLDSVSTHENKIGPKFVHYGFSEFEAEVYP